MSCLCHLLLAHLQALVQETGEHGALGCRTLQLPGSGLRGSGQKNVSNTFVSKIQTKICSIEGEDRDEFMMQETLLKRYSVTVNGQVSQPMNVIEKAVDLHALRIIGSSGYQRCISYLWKGWLVQDDADVSQFVPFKDKTKIDYWTHFDPDRMRTPQYQNALQIFFSVLYLVLYTVAINTINSSGDLDIIEGILYLMTAGFVFDEIAKVFKDESTQMLEMKLT